MSRTCQNCGAARHVNDAWCSQCFASFSAYVKASDDVENNATGEESPGAVLAVAALTAQPEPIGSGSPATTMSPPEAEATWSCATCETVNPMSSNVCSACGDEIYSSFGRATPQPTADPESAVRGSLLMPGLGHARLGESILGFAIGTVFLVGVVFGIVLALTGQLAGWIILAIGAAVYPVAIVDTRRVSEGSESMLTPRALLLVVGAIFVIFIGSAFSQIIRAGS